MKKVVGLMVVLAVFGFISVAKAADAPVAANGSKFGYVDLNRVLNECNEGKAAKAKLEADGKAKKQKLEIMQNDLKKMKEDIDKQRLILSADAMKQKEAEFQQKFLDLQKTSMDFEKEFSEKESTAIKPISDKIQKVIQSIGSTGGFSLIIPREMALYSPSGTDLTDRVISDYNSGKGK